MGPKEYTPRPIEIASVHLDASLQLLLEALARNAHDMWAQQRLSQGWVWGEHRCDHRKTHPCLIPYEDLPEVEKEYDRLTALATLKAIVALGYTIVSPTAKNDSDGNS